MESFRLPNQLRDLNDVSITGTPTTGYALIFNGTKWEPVDLSIAAVDGLQAALDGKSDDGHTHTLSEVTDAGTAASRNVGTSSGNVPVLDGTGKLSQGILPGIALTDTFVIDDQSEMLALSAQTGDVAVRSDLNKSFILKGDDPTDIDDWQELLTPTDSVQSVNGEQGSVVLGYADVGAAAESHVHSGGDITSGTVADARLSSNVALLDAANAFTGNNTSSGTFTMTSNNAGVRFLIEDSIGRDAVIFGNQNDGGFFKVQYVTGSAYMSASTEFQSANLNVNRGSTANNCAINLSRSSRTVGWAIGSWANDATDDLSIAKNGLNGTKALTINHSTLAATFSNTVSATGFDASWGDNINLARMAHVGGTFYEMGLRGHAGNRSLYIFNKNLDNNGEIIIDLNGTEKARFNVTGIGFFGVTPVARQSASTDIKDALTNYGLLQGTSAAPLDLDGGAFSAGPITANGALEAQTTSFEDSDTIGNVPAWYRVVESFGSGDISGASGGTESFELFTLNSFKRIISGVRLKLNEAWVEDFSFGIQVSIGDGTDPEKYMSNTSINDLAADKCVLSAKIAEIDVNDDPDVYIRFIIGDGSGSEGTTQSVASGGMEIFFLMSEAPD